MAVAYAFQSVLREAMPCWLIFPMGSLHDGHTSAFRGMYSMHSGHFFEPCPSELSESIEARIFFISSPFCSIYLCPILIIDDALFQILFFNGDLAVGFSCIYPILDYRSLLLSKERRINTLFFGFETIGCRCFFL